MPAARQISSGLRPHLKTIPLKAKQILHPVNEPVRQVLLPQWRRRVDDDGDEERRDGGNRDGRNEGLVGINAYFGGQMLSGETMLQVPVPDASAEVMSAETFKRELGRDGPFQECVHRYSQGLLMLMMQSTGCMALHPVQERCCRWLLMTHDRIRQMSSISVMSFWP